MQLLFILRKQRIISGQHPIWLRITIEGKRSHYTTKQFINEKYWDQQSQRAIGRNNTALNDELKDIKKKAFDVFDALVRSNRALTSVAIKKGLESKGVKGITLSQLMTKYAEYHEEVGGRAPATIQKYKNISSIVENNDMLLKHADKNYSHDLWFYLKKDQGLSIRTANKYFEQIMAAVRFAEKKGWIDSHGMVSVREKWVKSPIIFLTEEELVTLEKKKMISRLDVIRDIFLFQCHTGFEYGRVRDLKTIDMQLGVDGRMWLYTNREKTSTYGNLPIHPKAQSIIDKYSKNECRKLGKVFPVSSNAKSNAYLKEVGDICGFSKSLHTHLARHTFATTICLLNGLSYEVTAAMMGISIQTLVKNYGRIVPKRIAEETKQWSFLKRNDKEIKGKTVFR